MHYLNGVLIEQVIDVYMVKGTNKWTIEMGDFLFGIMLILSCILLITAGLLFFKDMTKVEVAKSATFMVGYYVIFLILEGIIFSASLFTTLSSIYLILFVPLRLFSTLHQLSLRYLDIAWIGIAMSLIFPYVFVLFGLVQQYKDNTISSSRDVIRHSEFRL